MPGRFSIYICCPLSFIVLLIRLEFRLRVFIWLHTLMLIDQYIYVLPRSCNSGLALTHSHQQRNRPWMPTIIVQHYSSEPFSQHFVYCACFHHPNNRNKCSTFKVLRINMKKLMGGSLQFGCSFVLFSD